MTHLASSVKFPPFYPTLSFQWMKVHLLGSDMPRTRCPLAWDKMCKMSQKLKYWLDSGSVCLKCAKTHFGIIFLSALTFLSALIFLSALTFLSALIFSLSLSIFSSYLSNFIGHHCHQLNLPFPGWCSPVWGDSGPARTPAGWIPGEHLYPFLLVPNPIDHQHHLAINLICHFQTGELPAPTKPTKKARVKITDRDKRSVLALYIANAPDLSIRDEKTGRARRNTLSKLKAIVAKEDCLKVRITVQDGERPRESISPTMVPWTPGPR